MEKTWVGHDGGVDGIGGEVHEEGFAGCDSGLDRPGGFLCEGLGEENIASVPWFEAWNVPIGLSFGIPGSTRG